MKESKERKGGEEGPASSRVPHRNAALPLLLLSDLVPIVSSPREGGGKAHNSSS
jgi:hypothetical protein